MRAGVQFEVVVALLELEQDASGLDGQVLVEVGEEIAVHHLTITPRLYQSLTIIHHPYPNIKQTIQPIKIGASISRIAGRK